MLRQQWLEMNNNLGGIAMPSIVAMEAVFRE